MGCLDRNPFCDRRGLEIFYGIAWCSRGGLLSWLFGFGYDEYQICSAMGLVANMGKIYTSLRSERQEQLRKRVEKLKAEEDRL